jgi:dephospho-CoA kinase
MIIIGISGRAGVGKDTVAKFLCETHGFVQIAFADPLRAGLKAMFGLTDDHFEDRTLKQTRIDWIGRSPRELMQTLGTEWGRHIVNPEIWQRTAARRIRQILAADPCQHVAGVVLSDIRFDNEAEFVRDFGGQVWHIWRPHHSEASGHTSELGVRLRETDRLIINDQTIEVLTERSAFAVESLFAQENPNG